LAPEKCRDCGAIISPNAKSCPNCGITTKKKVGPLGFYILIGVAVFVIFSIVEKVTADAPNAFAPATVFAQATNSEMNPWNICLPLWTQGAGFARMI
jgi:RNA polymerase subunit RPABC4/transcription elongation factor Spt4